jgi:hypothetical protein
MEKYHYQPRSVDKIIIEILKLIPEKEKELVYELQNYLDSLFNQCPEALMSSYVWVQLSNILNKFIPEIFEDWHIKVNMIIINQTNNIEKNKK